MAKLGRPKKPKAERRAETVLFRMTADERRAIELAAKRRGELLSDWIRAELVAAAEVQFNMTDKEPGIESH